MDELLAERLKVLKDAGLICGRIDGKNSCYGLDPDGITELRGTLDALLDRLSGAVCCTAEPKTEIEA